MDRKTSAHIVALNFELALHKIEGCKCSADDFEAAEDFCGLLFECLFIYLNNKDAINALKNKYSTQFAKTLSALLSDPHNCIDNILIDIKYLINKQI